MNTTTWQRLGTTAVTLILGVLGGSATLVAQDAAEPMAAPADAGLVVGPGGLSLYPRWSKAFRPLAELAPGEELSVLTDHGAWRQVAVVSSGAKGWVFCELAAPADAGHGLDLPLAASPTTSGLVVKGWSPRQYALRSGSDLDAVLALLGEPVDEAAFAAFLAEDPDPAAGPLPAPDLHGGDVDARTQALGDRARRVAGRPDTSAGLGELPEGWSDTAQSLSRAKGRIAGRAGLGGDLFTLIDEQDEFQLGQGVAARVLHERPRSDDRALEAYVGLVGQRLARHVAGAPPACRFVLLAGDEVHACSAPGGFVFVTEGAVAACHDEAELASLLAHELAHLSLRHAVATLSQGKGRLMSSDALASLDEQLPPGDPRLKALIEELHDLGDSLYAATQRPFAHKVEHEADFEALAILARAGYDPRAARDLLARVAASGDGGPRLPSHPDPAERVMALDLRLAEMKVPAGVRRNAARFAAHVAPAKR